ncbi:hypothetical protein [Cellulomonas septica]|uniref:BON domain-containing protein n=1 Tax=Cellulomonas septica TaxID=285080 RepID=A0ABX1K0A1_9CELL|nr:hypothetical protein [Cellulomonas septica]NKY39998.1 hypothetical protein [Cellulomonas septica]
MTGSGKRARPGWLPAIVALVPLVAGAGACAGQVDGASDDVPSTSAPSTGQPDAGYAALDLAVLDALADDPHPKDARYEPDRDRVVVTVRTQGDALDDDARRALEEKAEAVTDGVDVVVEVTDQDTPVEE